MVGPDAMVGTPNYTGAVLHGHVPAVNFGGGVGLGEDPVSARAARAAERSERGVRTRASPDGARGGAPR